MTRKRSKHVFDVEPLLKSRPCTLSRTFASSSAQLMVATAEMPAAALPRAVLSNLSVGIVGAGIGGLVSQQIATLGRAACADHQAHE